MTLDQDVAALRKVPLFRGIDDAKLRLLAFMSERVRFDAGETIVEEGDFGDTAYIILEGAADVLINTPAGEQHVATVKEHDFVGEIAILIDVPRTATVRAATPVIVLTVTKEKFFKLVTNFPDMGIEVMRALAHRLERTTRELGRLRAGAAPALTA